LRPNLQDCPCCGSNAVWHDSDVSAQAQCVNMDCSLETFPEYGDGRWEATAKKWNRRPETTYHLNGSGSVAVGTERFIRDFTMCPRGVKVQLLNPGGVALYGVYDGDPQWQGWYPVPGAPE
jgi:hypothetical protein